MLSIGPREELENYGIQVINNLSVGRNLQDYVGTYGLIIALNFSSTSKNISTRKEIFCLVRKHIGDLYLQFTFTVSAFLQTMFQYESGVPDI